MNDLTREEQLRACSECIDDALTTGESMIPVEVAIILLNEVDSLRDKIERFGNTDDPTEFDWNVLRRIDELEGKNSAV